MSSEILVRTGDDLVSGIKTAHVLNSDIRGFRVTWIEWDSDFRNGGLQIEDLIVGIDDDNLEQFLRPGKVAKGIGQANESLYWKDVGARPDQTIKLKLIRASGDGKVVEIPGRLHAFRFYYDKRGRNALGPGGPPRLAPGELFTEWSMWYEKLVWKMSYILDGGLDWKSVNTKTDLEEHEGHKNRIDFLLKNYPGPFADVASADWTTVKNILRGKKADQLDLGYRELGAKRVETVRQQAAKAWNDFRNEISKETIPTFPAVEIGDRGSVVGKVVELPWITPRGNIINDLGQTYAIIGSPSDGFYFILLSSSPDVYRFYDAMYRYKAQVNPRLEERYQYTGRILDEPRMIMYRDRPVSGLLVQILAGRAGQEELFVDVRKVNEAGKCHFAGEAAISHFEDATSLPADASPAQVLEEMIRAIKFADEESWKRLFADWQVITYDDGHSVINTSYAPSSSSLSLAWEKSRRLMMGDVYDARVDKVERIRRIVRQESSEKGLPDVDEVTSFIDHYGLFDGEYRSFLNVNVHRRWVLQRLNNGPWKITSVQII